MADLIAKCKHCSNVYEYKFEEIPDKLECKNCLKPVWLYFYSDHFEVDYNWDDDYSYFVLNIQ